MVSSRIRENSDVNPEYSEFSRTELPNSATSAVLHRRAHCVPDTGALFPKTVEVAGFVGTSVNRRTFARGDRQNVCEARYGEIILEKG
jgi:hypothetical protein